MSPEQASGKSVDFRTDQFSLGVMLSEMLTSRRPFRHLDVKGTRAALWGAPNSGYEPLNLRAPLGLQSILERCLAKDPVERYGSTAELARDLRLVRDQVAAVPRKRPSAFTVIAVALIAAGLIDVASFLHSRHAAPGRSFYTAVPLTTYPGAELCPSPSPDGQRLAFAWNGEKQDNFDIYVKHIGVAEPVRLTTDPRPEFSPAWSPDGKTIAFVRLLSHEKGEVLLCPSAGSRAARRLTEIAAPGASYEVLENSRLVSGQQMAGALRRELTRVRRRSHRWTSRFISRVGQHGKEAETNGAALVLRRLGSCILARYEPACVLALFGSLGKRSSHDFTVTRVVSTQQTPAADLLLSSDR
jgi:WD40-like Beta Propeller Repeat